MVEHAPAGFEPAEYPGDLDDLSRRLTERVADERPLHWGFCIPTTLGDNPHVSTWKPKKNWDVSAHGWWEQGSCGDDDRATVTARLYEWYKNRSGFGAWVFKAKDSPSSPQKTRKRGGQDAVARKGCQSADRTTWLNVVDVDVDGKADPGGVSEHKADSIPCRVWD